LASSPLWKVGRSSAGAVGGSTGQAAGGAAGRGKKRLLSRLSSEGEEDAEPKVVEARLASFEMQQTNRTWLPQGMRYPTSLRPTTRNIGWKCSECGKSRAWVNTMENRRRMARWKCRHLKEVHGQDAAKRAESSSRPRIGKLVVVTKDQQNVTWRCPCCNKGTVGMSTRPKAHWTLRMKHRKEVHPGKPVRWFKVMSGAKRQGATRRLEKEAAERMARLGHNYDTVVVPMLKWKSRGARPRNGGEDVILHQCRDCADGATIMMQKKGLASHTKRHGAMVCHTNAQWFRHRCVDEGQRDVECKQVHKASWQGTIADVRSAIRLVGRIQKGRKAFNAARLGSGDAALEFATKALKDKVGRSRQDTVGRHHQGRF